MRSGDAPDYSLKECWLRVTEVTKGVDAFYIYSIGPITTKSSRTRLPHASTICTF